MQHDLLGELRQTDCQPFDAVATLRHGGRDVTVNIDRDDQPLETTLALAAELARRLPELDALAKQVAARDLCESYNDGWNEFDVAQADGSFQRVSNPELSAAEFAAKLTLAAVNVTGEGMLEFFYDDQRMFWGHSVFVSSLQSTDLSEASAESCG